MTDKLREAAAELLAVKELKDEELRMRQRRPVRDREKIAACEAMRIDYAKRKPLAWAALRAALAEPQAGPQPVEVTEMTEERIELVAAWNDLPEELRCHPGLNRLYRAAQKA